MSGISKDLSNPIRQFQQLARSAVDANELDQAIRKEDSGECVRGDRSFKEWFISWFPKLSQWCGVSLSSVEKKDNIAASNEFISALSHCLGEDKAGAVLKTHMGELGRGLPLTARKVADILLEADLDKEAAQCNANNRKSFYSWYTEQTGDKPKQGTPGRETLRALITGYPEAYERELTNEDFSLLFVQLVLDRELGVLNQLRSGAGMLFSSDSFDELDQAIDDLKQDEADLLKALSHLEELNESIKEDVKGGVSLTTRVGDAITQVKARLAQTQADLYPKQENTIILEKQALPKTMRESLAEQYMEDALKWHEESSYLNREGESTKDPEAMLIRNQGFGNDIGRCKIKLSGEDIPVKKEKADVVQLFLKAFQEKYGEDRGKRYLMQLSNTLGQALFAGVLTGNMSGEGVTGDMLSAVPGTDAKYAAVVSYDIELKDDGVHVIAKYSKPVDFIMQNPMGADRLSVAADRDQSYTEIGLDFVFNPEEMDDNLFSLNESGCYYGHKVVPKTHDQVRTELDVDNA